jgi:hypothetical protein
MSSTIGAGGGAATRPATGDRYETAGPAGYGWVVFAATMVAIVGSLNVIYGIAAISDSRFYARDVTYIISNLNTWGWALLIVGIVQVCAAAAIAVQAPGARWIGILSAAVNMIIQLLVLPAAPLLALSLFAIDILVIYGLLAHGRAPAAA